MTQYRELGLRPSAKTIYEKFNSWTAAKRAAGLTATEHGSNPAFVDAQNGYAVDEDYFESIETTERGYWLGFFTATATRSTARESACTSDWS